MQEKVHVQDGRMTIAAGAVAVVADKNSYLHLEADSLSQPLVFCMHEQVYRRSRKENFQAS